MIAEMRLVTPNERATQAATNTATTEQKHWFWTAGSRVAHRFTAEWMEPGPAGRFDKALCGAGPAVWPAYCGCPEHPEDRRRCMRCTEKASHV